MSTKIETKSGPIQTGQTRPNLGGPTSNCLDKAQREFNLAWAQKYEKLNDTGASE